MLKLIARTFIAVATLPAVIAVVLCGGGGLVVFALYRWSTDYKEDMGAVLAFCLGEVTWLGLLIYLTSTCHL